VGAGGARLAAIEAATRRRFFLVAAAESGHVHLDHLEVLEQGKLDSLRPEAPVAEGATIVLKLLEVGLHDAAAGVGKVDGYEVVVADAAKLVGKKVGASVGRVLDGVAYATLADKPVADLPITFEAEAEKPTRAARARGTLVPDAVVAEPDEPALPEIEAEPATAEAADAGEAVEAGAPAPVKKKRARRGSRGGRRRKKAVVEEPSANGDGAVELVNAPESTTTEEAQAVRPRAANRRSPRIHVPDRGPDEAAEPDAEIEVVPEQAKTVDDVVGPEADGAPRKKTRRGTRGGRRRRKAGASPEAAEEGSSRAEARDETSEAASTGAPASYVPMSEWIEDFDRTGRGSPRS